MIRYLLMAVEKTKGVTKLSADLIKTIRKVRKSFLLFFFPVFAIIFCFAECQTPQQKAEQFPLKKEQACPNFGKLNSTDFELAIYQDNNSGVHMIQLESSILVGNRAHATQQLELSWAVDALSINNRKDYTMFEDIYKALCAKQVPFATEIQYNKKLIEEKQKVEKAEQEEIKKIEEIAKAAKINVDEILDLRYKETREDFILAWYNSKENPDVLNDITYEENEFKFENDKKKFQDYRNYKYAITDTFQINGEYDFKKKAFQISSDTKRISGQYLHANHFQRMFYSNEVVLNKPFINSETIKSSISFSIPPAKAEKFKVEANHDWYKEEVIILTKFSPAYFRTTVKCNFDLRHYEQCRKNNENQEFKLKYLSLETLKYRIVFDGEVYKNY